MANVPTNFYQLERDLKSFKSDPAKKQLYLLQLKPEHISKIFKTDLEADSMLSIFKTFLAYDE